MTTKIDRTGRKVEHTRIRGIYLNAYTVADSSFPSLLDSVRASGINTVVFDLKNMHGEVFSSGLQNRDLRGDFLKPVLNITETVSELHKRDLKAVSRVVMFHDRYLARTDSTLRPKHRGGGYWVESRRRGPSWLDPSNPRVQSGLLDLLENIARYQVDEIQLDYIRFPTQGDLDDAVFHFQETDSVYSLQDSNYVKRDKPEIIAFFLEKASSICRRYGVKLTADVFAITAWQRNSDVNNTGQDLTMISPYLDSIHPMIYSSHFNPSFGFRQDIHNEPYYLVYQAGELCRRYTADSCRVIPYIQANSWKVNFKKEYLEAQIRAVEALGLDGYILWNSSNNYADPLKWLKCIHVSRET